MQIGVSWEGYLPGDWPAVLREGGAPLQSKPVGFNREQKLTGRQVGERLAVNLVGVVARGESATFTRDENFHFAIDNFHCNRPLITGAGDALFRGEGISDRQQHAGEQSQGDQQFGDQRALSRAIRQAVCRE